MAENKDLEILKGLLNSDAFAQNVGIKYEEVRGGYCRVRMTVGKQHLNFLSNPHGAAVFAVADAAFAGSCNGHGELAVAVTVTVDFLAAVKEGTALIGEATEIHRTRKIGHYRLEVRTDSGELAAQAKGTAYFLGKTFTDWEKSQKGK